MKLISKRFSAGLAAVVLTPMAAAAAGPAVLHSGVPAWSPEGSDLSIDIRGRVFYDFADIDSDFALASPEGGAEEWRAQRIGADIRYGDTKITAEFEFAGTDDVEAADLYLSQSLGGGLSVTVGHFKEAVSMEEQTSSRFTTFMERGALTDAFGISRRVGAKASMSGTNWSWTAAIQGGTMDGLDVESNGWAASGRAGFAPVLDEDAGRYVHLGASVRYRDHGGASDPLYRYRQRPNAHLAPNVVATPAFADSDLMLAAEAAAGFGAFHVEGELARLSADGAAGGADADFMGGFVQAGWYVTGESRAYDVGDGRFDRVKPKTPLGDGGFGAVEIAARLDWVDLDDGAIAGGDVTTRTLGVNWLPTARTRIAANFVDADVDGGPYGGGDSEILQMRFQFDW